MTNIIRLNESTNDYASRPVITALGEPLIAIHPSTYQSELGGLADIAPQKVLVDGNYGQTTPSPFVYKIGTGNTTVKSDSNGAYLSFNQSAIRANDNTALFNLTKSALMIVKFRIAKAPNLTSGLTRLFSLNYNGPIVVINAEFINNKIMLAAAGVTSSGSSAGTVIEELIVGKIYTAALYRTFDRIYINIDNKVIIDAVDTLYEPFKNAIVRGLGINTRAIDTASPILANTDVFDFELYDNVDVSNKQIADYLLTF